jgi:hypothetical protein
VRRRVLSVIIGSVALNLALMSIMFMRMRADEKCDVSARGLVARTGDSGRWMTIEAPSKASDLPPCRARLTHQQLEYLPE